MKLEDRESLGLEDIKWVLGYGLRESIIGNS